MSRVQLALNVTDIDKAVEFYSKLFATEPAKRKPGYGARWEWYVKTGDTDQLMPTNP